jgi:hypothetical protein
LATAKDEFTKEFYRQNSNYIEMWANAQMNAGLKFTDCDRFHYIQKPLMEDNDNTFISSSNNCSCGISGETFLVEKK